MARADIARNLRSELSGNSRNAILIEMLSYAYEHKPGPVQIEERVRIMQVQEQVQKEAEAIAPAHATDKLFDLRGKTE